MKIIGKSNFDIETVDDILLCEKVDMFYAKSICDALNTDRNLYFFKVVEDDHKLYKFEY